MKNCEPCALSGKSLKPRQPPIQSIPWPEEPWSEVSIDIFGEIQAAPESSKFLLVINDLHSKWPEVAALRNVTSTTVISVLTGLFARWGIPKSIITDNGSNFTSREFRKFLRDYGIRHKLCAYYNLQANSVTERFNRVIKEGLKTHLLEGKSFDESIKLILQNYRATKHSLTNKSPAELMIGRNLRLPLDCLKPETDKKTSNSVDISKNVKEKQLKSKVYTDKIKHAKLPDFKIGDWVRIRRPDRGHKLKPTLSPPQRIAELLGKSSYRLEDRTVWNARRLVHSFKKNFNTVDNHYEYPVYDSTILLGQAPSEDSESPKRLPSRSRHLPNYLRDYELS